MKAIITRPDGTRIEFDGTPEEIQRAVLALSPAPLPSFEPIPVPLPYIPAPVLPWAPVWPLSPTVEPWPTYRFGNVTCGPGWNQ